jgi:hypothetical protein
MGHYMAPKLKSLGSPLLRYDICFRPSLDIIANITRYKQFRVVFLEAGFPTPYSQDEFDSCDSKYWTILALTPIWYSRARQDQEPMVDTGYMKIEAIHVTMLSGIKNGLSSAVESWIEIGDHLEKLLGEDTFHDPEAHDKFCFYDHNDLSQSKKSFWIINSVNKFDKHIQDILYQWEWFHQTHVKYLLSGESNDKIPQHEILNELRNDIDLLHQNRKAQSGRFLSMQKEARELRDGVSYLLSCI